MNHHKNHNQYHRLNVTSSATLVLLGAIGAIGALAAPSTASSAEFKGGNFVVYRVGSEAGARSVYLDEYGADGKPLNNSINLSAAVPAFAASLTKSEGLLTRSANGKCLAVPGFASAPGATDISASAATAVPRAVALVGADGHILSQTPLGTTAFTKDSIRSAASNDCTQLWASGNGDKTANKGLWYATPGGTAVSINTANTHGLALANQQLHAGNAATGLAFTTPALPTAAATVTNLTGIPAGTYRGIAFVDLNPGVTGADTVYLADNSNGVLSKFTLTINAWVVRGSIALSKIHGLVAMATGEGNVLLYATDQNGVLYQLFDNSGAQGSLNGTWLQVASAATNAAGESFYGLALTPEATPPTSAPAAPTAVKVTGVSGNTGNLQWSAPKSGASVAFYVVELSRDGFVSVDQSAFAAGTNVALTNLQTGQTARVRAVNSFGGSASAVSTPIAVGAPPSTDLADNTAYSAVVGDANDELATQGLRFKVTDPASGTVTVTPASSKASVIADANIKASISGSDVTLTLQPSAVGYADISLTITASNGVSITRTIKFAASANTAASSGTRWYTGRSDASSAITIPGSGNIIVVDDEAPVADAASNALPGGNALYAYAPGKGGQPVGTLVPDAALNLSKATSCTDSGFTGIELSKCKADGEVDLESSFIVGQRMYFAGSHSNNKNGRSRPDRWRVFGVDVNPADQSTTVSGFYQWLREDMRTWDSTGAHQLGANYLGLVASSNGADDIAQAPESDTLSGFSIEGSTTSPDDSQMWLGFRAPLVQAPGSTSPVTANSATNRTHALIVRVSNYAAMLTASGGTKGAAQIGSPIRVDLGGRGIREIRKNAAGEYLIIAGPPNGANGTAPRDFRLYAWDGSANSAGLALNVRALNANLAAFTAPNIQCSAEGIANVPASLAQGGSATIISDCGDADFYADGSAAKDLPFNEWKKFRSDAVSIAALPTLTLQASGSTASGASLRLQSAQAGTARAIVLPAGSKMPSWEQIMTGTDANDQPALWASTSTSLAANVASTLQATGLAANTNYLVWGVIVPVAGPASVVTPTQFSTGAPPVIPGTINFAPLTDRIIGSAAFTVSATGSIAGTPVTFSSQTSTVCATGGTQGATVTLLKVGTCTIRATQTGSTSVDQGFQITLPATSGTTLPGSNGASANVSGSGWQFAASSAGSAPTSGLPALPSGYQFVLPNGFSFTLASPTPSGAATVALSWPLAAPAGAALWKYGPTKANPAPHWFDVAAQFSSDRKGASFALTDGGDGDQDQTANGVIVDPVFLVGPIVTTVPVVAASVPTLSDVGKVLLGLGLALAAMLGMRKKHVRF